MTEQGKSRESPEDAAALRDHAAALLDAVDDAIPRWVERCVRTRAGQAGLTVDGGLRDATAQAARAARSDGVVAMRVLLEADIDDHRTTPLAILRSLVSHPTAVLRDSGVPPVDRSRFDAEAFPDDAYDLTPASFAEVDPALHEPGIVWGAAKAHVHLARHRR